MEELIQDQQREPMDDNEQMDQMDGENGEGQDGEEGAEMQDPMMGGEQPMGGDDDYDEVDFKICGELGK
jgi:hypothetical protein